MFYQFGGYLALMQNCSIISLEQLTFWKLSCSSCFIWFLWWYLYRYKTVLKEKRAQIIAQGLEEFHPEPLFKIDTVANGNDIETSPIATEDVDLASNDFLSLRHEKQIKVDAEATILKYGVGTCGPRAFYGTADIHIELEESLNNWLSTGNEETKVLLYSYQQCTISSVISAFCTKDTLCFVDEQCSQSMYHGLEWKKVEYIVTFNHNCAKSLQSKLNQYMSNNPKLNKRQQRCFLMVEGIYYKTGQILNYELLKLARKYKIRVILDESLSVGTLGKSGKGITEYYNIKNRLDFIDITLGSLEHALHSIGGFIISTLRCYLEQQFLSTAYVFSASLPVFSAKSVLTGLKIIKNRDFVCLKDLSCEVHSFLIGLNGFKVCSSEDSPLKVVVIDKNIELFNDHCKARGVYMILKKNAVKIGKVLRDALYLQLKLEFRDIDNEKMDRFYSVLKDAHAKIYYINESNH